jgi:hypothetical protein
MVQGKMISTSIFLPPERKLQANLAHSLGVKGDFEGKENTIEAFLKSNAKPTYHHTAPHVASRISNDKWSSCECLV